MSTQSGLWEPNALRLFLTHTSEHKAEVGAIRDALGWYGVSGFVAHVDINPTHAWQDVIETALGECDALAAYMTPDFHSSLWTDQEIGFCMARSVLIVPMMAGLMPYGFVGKYQAMNVLGLQPSEIAGALVDILSASALTAARMAPSVITTFIRSGSYNAARTNLQRLQHVVPSAWNPELAALVRTALVENSQLRDGTTPIATPPGWATVPDVVESMLKGLGY